jgi:DNA polymerase-3 subunit epsilon
VGIESQLSWLGKLNRSGKSDLDLNWRAITYCAIDLETTGLDFKTDEIISIGAVQIQSGRVITEANYYREVRPNQDPTSSSIRIHGIRAVDLAGALPIESVMPEFAELLRGRVVVAHAAWVESGFLRERLESVNLDFSKRLIDTASLARRCEIVEDDFDHEPSLELLARTLKLPVYSPHHALGDALTTAIVFLALATELERRRIERDGSVLTLRELLKMSGKSARTQW